MSAKILLSVAVGGAVGAVGRYVVMTGVGHWFHGQFPWATLGVNVVGSFVLGALIELMALVWSPSPELRAFMVVGILGAFTTFSTFSMDAYYLFERGDMIGTGLYMGASVALSITGLIAGLMLFRHILA